ncbi:hypothetical protein QTO17_22100 [Vibrio owensii]
MTYVQSTHKSKGVNMTAEQRRAMELRVARNRRNGVPQRSQANLERGIKESREWRASIELKSART